LVQNVTHYIRTVALLALALIELPNEQGAFFDNVGKVKMVTRDGDLFPYSVHTGATLTFTVNTTQISVSAVAARRQGNPGHVAQLKRDMPRLCPGRRSGPKLIGLTRILNDD